MNESKHQTSSLYEEVPAMAEINKVPGFDPRRFLSLTISKETGEKVWKLGLGYMRAWFRMARPNGRLKLKPLRITEQMAIIEAQVFLDRNDTEPLTNFTAKCSLDEAENGDYIKAAQDAALVVALSDAGFGIQFVDLIHKQNNERYGSEVPVQNIQEKQVPKQQHQVTVKSITPESANPVTAVDAQKQPVQAETIIKGNDIPKKEFMTEQLPVQTVVNKETIGRDKTLQTGQDIKLPVSGTDLNAQQKTEEHLPIQLNSEDSATMETVIQLPVQETSEKLPVQDAGDNLAAQGTQEKISVEKTAEQLPVQTTEDSLPVQEMAEQLPVQNTTDSLPVPAVAETSQESLPAASNQVSYTQDMSVEEILKKMTFSEAQNVVVDMGVCNGWTMAEVAERRAPSLKYYVYGGYKGNNNILKAAAKIMLESLTEQKAS